MTRSEQRNERLYNSDDWQMPLSYLVCKVYKYEDHFVNIDNKCIANDIIDLGRQRDNSFDCANIASRSELDVLTNEILLCFVVSIH